jgi:hypothetical protein
LSFVPADEVRLRRIAEIRGRRGSAERVAHIGQLAEEKAKPKKSAGAGSGRKSPDNSSEMYGHPWAVWFQMRDAGLEFLDQSAALEKKVTYGEVWDAITSQVGDQAGVAWRQLPHLLGFIGAKGYEQSGFIPTSLVVYQDDYARPGPGFFRLAVELGALNAEDAPTEGDRWTTMTEVQQQFWEAQMQGMFAKAAASDS